MVQENVFGLLYLTMETMDNGHHQWTSLIFPIKIGIVSPAVRSIKHPLDSVPAKKSPMTNLLLSARGILWLRLGLGLVRLK